MGRNNITHKEWGNSMTKVNTKQVTFESDVASLSKKITFTETNIQESEFLKELIREEQKNQFLLENRKLDIQEKSVYLDEKELKNNNDYINARLAKDKIGMFLVFTTFVIVLLFAGFFFYIGRQWVWIGAILTPILFFMWKSLIFWNKNNKWSHKK